MNYNIGISGLQTAQWAIELVGTNLANAGTEGYHRQELRTTPLSQGSGIAALGGVKVVGTRRDIDRLLEQQIILGQQDLGQVSGELASLQSIEAALGTVGSEGIGAALSGFFNALRELSSQPNSQPLQDQAVWAAQTLAERFRSVGQFLYDLDKQVYVEAQTTIQKVNGLSEEIAQANGEIVTVGARGGSVNLLLDRRDQAISDLSKLTEVTVDRATDGSNTVNVSAWGTPLVVRNHSLELEVGYDPNGAMGISVKGANYFQPDLSGGQLGGLMTLKNRIIPGLVDKLDTLARQVVTEINRLHVNGVGTAGSFSQLDGIQLPDPAAALSGLPDVQDGEFHVRLISPTGQSALYGVAVDASADSLTDIVDRINQLDPAHLRAAIVDGGLHLEGLAGYKFDFLPVPTTDTTGWTGPAPTASGIFTGSSNQTYTVTADAGGEIGVTDGLTLTVRDSGGQVVRVLAVGEGYPAGEPLEVVSGLHLVLGTGTVTNGQSFTVQALADGDTSGFLSAAGMNTLFTGSKAMSMSLRTDIQANPARLAVAVSASQADNANVIRMADVGQKAIDALGGQTPAEFYNRLVAEVGQDVLVRKAKAATLDTLAQQLANQREVAGGVDINQEAAKLLVFERMFQAMAKFIGAQDRAMQTLMDVV
jgi:flagellar hook-associated protein 1 FlgK